MSACAPIPPIPRLDPHLKSNPSNGISPKISQLRQIYTQQPKLSKQQQNELKKQNGLLDVHKHIPKKMFIDQPTMNEQPPTGISIKEAAEEELNCSEEKPVSVVRDLNLDKMQSTNNNNGTLKRSGCNEVNSNNPNFRSEPDSIITIEGSRNHGNYTAKECVEIARRAFKSGRTGKLGFREKQLKGTFYFLQCKQVA